MPAGITIYLPGTFIYKCKTNKNNLEYYIILIMSKKICLDMLLVMSIASFVSITLPITSIVISDYLSTRNYNHGVCNGSTLSNYKVSGGFFYHGIVDVTATVNGTEYMGFLYYPPIKHWPLGFMPIMDIDEWYDSLNKTGTFQCFVDLRDDQYPMVNEWLEIAGYYSMFVLSVLIGSGWCAVACVMYNSKQQRRRYISIPDELPPPYTPTPPQLNRQQSLYSSLNDELTTISF
jgi:hypothetical protein